MPVHGKITPEQWMAIAGALQNVGGMFGRPGQQGQGNQMMFYALEQQANRRKDETFRDLLKSFGTPMARGSQGGTPAGPTNLILPSMGGRAPVGSQLPGPSPQAQPGTPSQVQPGAPQPMMNPQLMALLGAMGSEKGGPLLAQHLLRGPQERFKVVRDPYGRGGVGQRSSTTGRIVEYRDAPDPQYSGDLKWDKRAKKLYELNPKTLKKEWVEKSGGKEPATVRLAEAYKQAMKDDGKTISTAKALRWAHTSVGKSPQDVWLQVYKARSAAIDSHEDASRIADKVVEKYMTFGAEKGTPSPVPGSTSGAQAAFPGAGPLASVSPIPGGLGPGERPPYPWRKPSMEGVNLLPGTVDEGALEIDSPKRPLPKTADGKLDAKRLKRGQVYEASDLTLWRWDGQGFTEVAE